MTTVYVNGEPLKPADIDEQRDRMREAYFEQFSDTMEASELEARLDADAVDNAIDDLLLRQAAGSAPLEVSDREVKHRINKLRQELVRDQPELARVGSQLTHDPLLCSRVRSLLLVEKFVAELDRDVPCPSDEVCREVYDKAPERFVIPEVVLVSQIVQSASQQRAAAVVFADMLNIRQALLEGADFATVARLIADDPKQDGNMGYIPRGLYPPAFDRVVFALEVGEISEVFTTEYGYHLARVSDRRAEEARRFSSVHELIRKELWQARKQKRLGEKLDALREAAEIRREEDPD